MIFGDATPPSSRIFAQACWIIDSIPWIEAFVQIRPYIFNRAPECVIRRLAEIRSPCGHSQFAAWSNATPEFAHSFCHIGHKENSEHAHDGIKTRDWKPHREHIADFEFDVAKTPLNCFRPRQLQKLLCKVNSYDVPVGPTASAAGRAEAPAPQQTSSTREPIGSEASSIVRRPK